MARPKKRLVQPANGTEAAEVLIKLMRPLKAPELELEIVMAALLLKLASTQWQEYLGSTGKHLSETIPKLVVPNGMDYAVLMSGNSQGVFTSFVKVIRAFVAVNVGRLSEGEQSAFPNILNVVGGFDASATDESDLHRLFEFIDGLSCFAVDADVCSRHIFLMQLVSSLYLCYVPKLRDTELGTDVDETVIGLVASHCTDISAGAIYDPVCGSGRFIVGVYAKLRSMGSAAQLSLCGSASNWQAWCLATYAMAVSGATDWLVNAPGKELNLHELKGLAVTANVVGVGKSENFSVSRYQNLLEELTGSLVEKKADVVCLLANKGLLYRDGEEFRWRREWVDKNLLEMVAEIPDGMVKNVRGETALVVLRSARAGNEVSFTDVIRNVSQGENGLTSGYSASLSRVQSENSDNAMFSSSHVDRREILEKNYNLNPVRYVLGLDCEMTPPLIEIRRQIQDLLVVANAHGKRIDSMLESILQFK